MTGKQNWVFSYCPTAPDWQIDWQGIEKKFDWFKNLKGCPQNPIYHGEGDVYTHTKMVCQALVSDVNWLALSQTDRSILFVAALLHDVAKPACTKIEDNGRISSLNHVRLGVKIARRILWDLVECQPPFFVREEIVALIKFGSLPLWFLEKDNPKEAIIKASLSVSCWKIAILAKADINGRICRDSRNLLERIELFCEYAQENQCLRSAKQFPSDYSRFIYFNRGNKDPDYEPYDDTWGEVILMSGLPASGKDHWLEKNVLNLPVISLDNLRAELKVGFKKNQDKVVRAAQNQAKIYLRSQTAFVWNATNIVRAHRRKLIDLFAAYGAKTKIVYLETDLKELKIRNLLRQQIVPEKVIERYISNLEIPDLSEAPELNWVVN